MCPSVPCQQICAWTAASACNTTEPEWISLTALTLTVVFLCYFYLLLKVYLWSSWCILKKWALLRENDLGRIKPPGLYCERSSVFWFYLTPLFDRCVPTTAIQPRIVVGFTVWLLFCFLFFFVLYRSECICVYVYVKMSTYMCLFAEVFFVTMWEGCPHHADYGYRNAFQQLSFGLSVNRETQFCCLQRISCCLLFWSLSHCLEVPIAFI